MRTGLGEACPREEVQAGVARSLRWTEFQDGKESRRQNDQEKKSQMASLPIPAHPPNGWTFLRLDFYVFFLYLKIIKSALPLK